MARESPGEWPRSIENWRAFDSGEPWLATEEFPLFTDAWVTGQAEVGPYLFINTVALRRGTVRPAIVLRYPLHRAWLYPDFRKTNAELYHGGSPPQELAALGSLAIGVRLRAGRPTRRFEPKGDPVGTPTESGGRATPFFDVPEQYKLPSAAEGGHALGDLSILNCLLQMSRDEACAVVRAARLYQDALWLAESEPEMSWLLIVSALETAANEWQKEKGDNIARLRDSKPALHAYLASLRDRTILSTVAEHVADSLGSTRKFVSFVLEFLPEPPARRPPTWAQFSWEPNRIRRALKTIYGYRSHALHDGRPFPLPMCETPTRFPTWETPAETMVAMATSARGAVWRKEDIPMNLHLFEYIARNALLKWWKACAQRTSAS